jgi:hypothetical protein
MIEGLLMLLAVSAMAWILVAVERAEGRTQLESEKREAEKKRVRPGA